VSRTVAHVVDTWLIGGARNDGSVGYVVNTWVSYEVLVVDMWLLW